MRADQIQSSWYGAAGANVSIPVFNGFEYTARAKEADLRAKAAQEQVRNLRDDDCARCAHRGAERADRLPAHRRHASSCSTRPTLRSIWRRPDTRSDLSGIVDLTQAQLAQTEAQIGLTNARYAYQTALAVVRYQTGQ